MVAMLLRGDVKIFFNTVAEFTRDRRAAIDRGEFDLRIKSRLLMEHPGDDTVGVQRALDKRISRSPEWKHPSPQSRCR
jgi:hypothetical protein